MARSMRRTLVLDNLIHGYFILDHPERLDYDYEHIYALVAYRAAKAGGKVVFKPAAEVKEPETPDAPTAAKPEDNHPATPAIAEPRRPAPRPRNRLRRKRPARAPRPRHPPAY